MKLQLFVLLTLSLTNVYANDGERVTKTERTGNSRIMQVGSCTPNVTRDYNGDVKTSFSLPVVSCVEYRTFDAIKTGSGWTAKFQKISGDRISAKVESDTEIFADYSYNSGNQDVLTDILTDAAISASLALQCSNKRQVLSSMASPGICQ